MSRLRAAGSRGHGGPYLCAESSVRFGTARLQPDRATQDQQGRVNSSAMCWSVNPGGPQQRSPNTSSTPSNTEEERKRAEHQHNRLLAADRIRDRAYYTQGQAVQRPASAPKPEYTPPPAHRGPQPAGKAPEKAHTALPKAEPNFNLFGYPAYQPVGFLAHDAAGKVKVSAPGGVKTSLEREASLPNPPPLMSDLKNSVIVKNEGGKQQASHEGGPKLYLSPGQYRSPSQSPHPLAHRHTPSPHHEAHKTSPRPAPPQQRQSPDQRYYHPAKPATVATYPYPSPGNPAVHYPLAGATAGPKPKVSSPAPPHIYGKPSAGITAGTPVCRPQDVGSSPLPLPLTSKAPLPASVSPSPYQQMSHHAPPLPPVTSQQAPGGPPPPAHSSRAYEAQTRLFPPLARGTASPPSHSVTLFHTMDQMQPLDLGVSATGREDNKRKIVPAPAMDASKKRRLEQASTPQLARVSEPSPLVLSAATTITTVVNTAVAPPDVCASPGDGSVRPSSTGSAMPIPAPAATPPQRTSPAPMSACSSPGLSATPPGKAPPPSSLDSDKSNSPGPPPAQRPTNYPVHKLKKAWLQRHSGEDGLEDTTGVTGGGSCETLPLTLPNTTTTTATSNIASLMQNVGSMAVSSICKARTGASNKGSNRKAPSTVKDTPTATFNGHGGSEMPGGKQPRGDASSSSDTEREAKMPPKRKANKVKRKKGGAATALRKAAAEELKRKKLAVAASQNDSSDSDKDSVTDKDSDSGGSAKKANGGGGSAGGGKEPRKRGRRPKSSKGDRGEEPSQKKGRAEPPALPVQVRDPFSKPPVSQLKKTGETFLQDGPCFEVAPKLAKCRECRWTHSQRSKNMPNIFCRFYAFRRLRYTKNGQLAIAGFSDPHRDAAEEDLKLWLPQTDCPPPDLDVDMTKFLLMQVGDHFCDLLEQEKEAVSIHLADDKTIAWKRVVQGVREMCDVCETTLFNFHWACGKCGFVVCIDCYKGRKQGSTKQWGDSGKDRDQFSWLLCTNRQSHEQEKLMLTQIIAGDSLLQLGHKTHEVRTALGIPQYCGCPVSKEAPLVNINGICKELLKNLGKSEPVNGLVKMEVKEEKDEEKEEEDNGGATVKTEDKKTPLGWLADVALSSKDEKKCEPNGGMGGGETQSIRNSAVAAVPRLFDVSLCSRSSAVAAVPSHAEVCSRSPAVAAVPRLTDVSLCSRSPAVAAVPRHAEVSIPGVRQSPAVAAVPRLTDVSLCSRSPAVAAVPRLTEVSVPGESGSSSDTEEDKEGTFSTLRELLIRPSHKPNGSRAASPATNLTPLPKTKKSRMDTLDEVISSVIESSVPHNETSSTSADVKPVLELKHFVRRYKVIPKGRDPMPIRIMTMTESKILYPDVPHSWLCDGKLLRLHDPDHEGNYHVFQDQWMRGQPVLVSDVTKHLDNDLWHPDSFARDFGDERNDLVNCMTGNLVPNQPMRRFWEGFEYFSRRLKDERGNPMLLKLKDWPAGEDFAEMLPSRFNDLMRVLPLSEYTHRTGRLNLASRLPDCFVRPDLGPKMYNAYGSALYPSKGTTNLHLDISDAVNVMMYVGIPKDGNHEEHIKEAYRAIDEANCDILTRRRVREKNELPGALWHIYTARDADKIRDLLNKVAIERGARLEPHHDPIHDQSWYLDGHLRERLYTEYGVEGYTIVQCLGDSVFIPAGAPHQVRNLHNCIKVAEDFVSPENVSHCFHMTQEFRELSDTHSNHEDKLQIKNIIYHAIKDSLSVLNLEVAKTGSEEKNSKTTDLNNGEPPDTKPAVVNN
uniref:[histone H3]-dimethyl-L-lysine(9) demethylase n=2 Tax=Timema TaxID=61471 RepID=A0A7R9ILJ1_9NEOP|nr:unnamed protein product [Timema tahoe]